ncbi:MAG: flagellar FliJ family protein [Buchnera aphidicola (Pentalonia nigronervosa)]|jgi:flagellar FliJ protein|uniref:Flagellar FliJ protein n=1 Tax=Buchnera aphidicola (Pentalonia nigronervosa) TaxID=1309793 RepID=A0A7H1AZB5_9GAMM|nr:MAG: flagellar FliJ family protein [Buchnera aphidicola (Pentalonia nigronervosa)]
MKSKNILFDVLKKATQKQIEQDIVKIKNLRLKKQNALNQSKQLTNYRNEYEKKLFFKIKSGMCVHQWKNYNTFILILKNIIKKNEYMIQNDQILIEEALTSWLKSKKKLRIWQYFINKHKIYISKLQYMQEQKDFDEYIQLTILKQGHDINVKNYM